MEANNFPNFQKCGEILIDINSKDKNNKIYIFHCTFCNTECDQLKKFSLHIGEEHLNDFETILCEADLKVEAEPEELQLETFTIIENPDNAFESHTGSITNMHSCRVKQELIDNYEDESIIYDKEPVYCTASASGFSNSRAKQKLGSAVESSSKNLMFATDSDELRCNAEQRANKKRRISFDGKDKLLKQMASTNDVSPDESKDGDCNLLTIDMPKGSDPPQPAKAKWKYCSKANNCEELSIKLQTVQDNMERQNHTIVEILAEHKALLLEILSQNKVVEDVMQVFPVKSENELSKLNILIQSQPDLYSRRMTLLLKGKVGRYLNEILGHNIIHDFNVDGTHGKQSLKKFESFYSSLIDAIAVFSDEPDAALRKAFQLQKKRVFKAKRLLSLKKKENESTDNENLENDSFI